MSQQPSPTDLILRTRPRLARVGLALRSIAESERLAASLREAGIPVMLLKGPQLQKRLYGDPATYVSSDVDVLVPRKAARRARETLERGGWKFEPENGVLWFLSSAASFVREGFRVDLHWGLHAAHLPAWSLRHLERDLWRGATLGSDGFFTPDDESLLVFLAVHAVGHDFERAHWVTNVHRASDRVTNWPKAWGVAQRARVKGCVRLALSEQEPGTHHAVLDGRIGKAIWWITFVARGHVIPATVRDRVREVFSMRREGFGVIRGDSTVVGFRGFEIVVEEGVFDPQAISGRLLDEAQRLSGDREPDVIVDVGTGSGAVAIAAAAHWPSATVVGLDVSARAVACARRNARRLGSRARFVRSNLLASAPGALAGRVAIAFSNVPYVAPVFGKDPGDWAVPASTVFGPEQDGLGLMRTLSTQVPTLLAPGGLWIFQIGDSQWESWEEHLSRLGYETIAPAERRPGGAVVGAARWNG